jgi:hypothetical protein
MMQMLKIPQSPYHTTSSTNTSLLQATYHYLIAYDASRFLGLKREVGGIPPKAKTTEGVHKFGPNFEIRVFCDVTLSSGL